MPLHTTNDPVKRAEHIAHHEAKVLEGDPRFFLDRIKKWLDTFDQTLKEFES